MAVQTSRTAPKQPAEVLVSLALDNFTHGGLIDDIDVEVTDAKTIMYDYNGQQPETPVLAIEYTDINGTATVQYYACGKAEDWKASENNKGFVPVSGKTGINDSTNLYRYLQSLADQGFPADLFAGGDLTVISGTKMHVNQVVVERKGLIRTGKNADRPTTVLLCTKIHSLPGTEDAKPAGKAKAGAAAAAAPASKAAVAGKANGAAKNPPAQTKAAEAPAAGDVDLDGNIVAALLTALGEAGDGAAIPRKDIPKLVFAHFGNDEELKAHANKAVARVANAAFLKSLPDQGIAFDGSQISMAG